MSQKLPPQPNGNPILGHFRQFKRNPIGFMLDSSERYGDIMRFRVLNRTIYFINHPDLVRHVLQTNYKNYKKSPGYQPLSLLSGQGIFTNDGEEWIRRRKFYQPTFSPSSVQLYSEQVIENTQRMLEQWAQIDKDEINVSFEMSKLTMAIISEVLFSQRIEAGTQMWDDLTFALDWIGERVLRKPYVLPHTWPLPKNQQFRKAVSQLDEVIYGLIEAKKRGGGSADDLLSRFMNPEDDKLKPLNPVELRDELMTIFVAGHETSANVLNWAFAELAARPEILRKAQDEIDALGTKEIGYNDLHNLGYCTQVLNETMRLYPPVWHLGRMSLGEDMLGEYPIPAGTYVRMSPLTMHRRKDFWIDPERFEPERFHPDRADELVPNSFIPFGAGPRLCAGRNFAMMEMVLILALVLRNYTPRTERALPKPSPGVTLRSSEAVRLYFDRR